MFRLRSSSALSLIVIGAIAIAAAGALVILAPQTLPLEWLGAGIIAFAALMMAAGISSFRLQGVAWRALADHLGDELLNLEAITTTATDHTLAFTEQEIVQISPNFLAQFALARPAKPEDLASGVIAAQQESLRESIRGLADAGEQFSRVVETFGGRQLAITGHRAQVRQGQPQLYVLRVRDVTLEREATRREQLLRADVASELSAWRERLNALPLPVWLRGPDLRLIWVNEAAAAAQDLLPSAMLAQQIELFSGTLGEDGRWLAEQAQLDRSARSDTAHLIVKGQRRLFQVTELPVSDEQETLGFALDLTVVEEKEAELKRHIAGNAAVLERMGAAIAIYGPDQRMTFHNQAFVDLWGLSESFLHTQPSLLEVLEELRSGRRLMEQADFRRYRNEQQQLFTSLLEPQEELQHLPDGRMLRVVVAPHPLGGLLFLYEDVSRRFELETSYNTLQAVQQETLDNLAEGICVYGPDGRLKLFNPAFARMWQLDFEVLQGEPHATEVLRRLRHFFPVADSEWPELLEKMTARTLDRNPHNGKLERSDGSVLDYMSIPLPDGAVLHSFLNITDSMRIQQALRESNEALEAADRLKSEFIANITYQLRTPLTAVMGFTEILRAEYFGALTERQQEYCGNIMEAGQRLSTLINDILELATIEAGHVNLDVSAVEIAPMLRAVADIVSDWARQEDLELEVTCAPEITTAQLDERRIRQALFNLLSNAIKFTPAGGRVRMSAELMSGQLVISVADNGIGISAQDKERIFRRFERANLRSGQAGAGLGLSVVKSIIEMHGGGIAIETAPNRGTRIICTLPLTRSSSSVAVSETPLA